MKNSDFLLKQNNGLCFNTAIDDRIFVLDSENGQYFWFNETASQLWCWLEKPMTSAQLTQQLLKNTNPQTVISNQNIEDWIHDALAKNLLCIYEDDDCNTTYLLLEKANPYLETLTTKEKIPPQILRCLFCCQAI